MSAGDVVVVGGGQAGFEAATRLRANSFGGSITIVGDECEAPYQRPPLSKTYLHDSDDDALALRPRSFYDDHDITLECGRAVTAINRQDQFVGLADGTVLDYDHLILATGARNRTLPVPGADLAGVHYLRTAREARDLVDAMSTCTSVVVIGAGFIGLEVAAAARKNNLTVTVLEALNRPMARAVSSPMSAYFAAEHAKNGVDLRLNTAVSAILGEEGHVHGVRTSDGQTIPADVVVVGIGVVPNSELADRAGLPTHNGIIVDHRLRTVDPHIWAIGDCAAFPTHAYGDLVRLESVQNAVDQARCVAAQLTGTPKGYHEIPWFWSEQYESKLQMVGLMGNADRHILRGSMADRKFSIFGFHGTQLVAVESVNMARDHMAARKILGCQMPVSPGQIEDNSFDLKDAVKQFQARSSAPVAPCTLSPAS